PDLSPEFSAAVWRCECGLVLIAETVMTTLGPGRDWRLASRRETKRALREVAARGSADGQIPPDPMRAKGGVFGRGSVPTQPPPPIRRGRQ
ncbi:MAG TPA: hypothetical protein VN738_03600, partial [Acidothermaceae bacterium]|nr:hypothetical protein [Acidothermaceae bacterium]